MRRAWLSLGSNIEREQNIRSALTTLQAAFGELVISRVYESEAVGFAGDAFYNLVVGVMTERQPRELVELFRQIESRHGRVREGGGFASRTLDIDLLTYGDQVIRDGRLELPRDEITRYAFVLLPLAEVAGDEIHPVHGQSYRKLWEAFDAADQALWPVPFEFDPGD